MFQATQNVLQDLSGISRLANHCARNTSTENMATAVKSVDGPVYIEQMFEKYCRASDVTSIGFGVNFLHVVDDEGANRD